MQRKGHTPGPKGLVPVDYDTYEADVRARKRAQKAARKSQRRERRIALQTQELARAHWWGFHINERPNNAARRAGRSSQIKGPFSRGIFLDAYGEEIDRTSPGDMEFAVSYIHPCKSLPTRVHVKEGRIHAGTGPR